MVIQLTDPLNDYYNRIKAMCLEAITSSRVVPDFGMADTNGLWWVIKQGAIRRISGSEKRSGRKFAYDIYFIQGTTIANQGKTREALYTNIWTILNYFDERNDLTTTTTDRFGQFALGMTFDLVNEGNSRIGQNNELVRRAQFRLEFNSNNLITRSI